MVGIGDWWFYHWQPGLIVNGHGFTDPWPLLATHHYRPSAAHPPLYSIVLSGLYLLGGHGALIQRSLGLVLGTVTLVLVGLLGRRVGGERLGVIAALLYAVYPVMIAVDGDLMSEVLYGPLIAGMLLGAFALIDRPTVRRARLLGVVIGLAALTRTEALLFVPFLLVPVAWPRAPAAGAGRTLLGRGRHPGLRRRHRALADPQRGGLRPLRAHLHQQPDGDRRRQLPADLPRGQHGRLGHHLHRPAVPRPTRPPRPPSGSTTASVTPPTTSAGCPR